MYGCKLLGCLSLNSVNTNQWPINNRQNLAILCTKRLTVVHQTLFSATTKKNGKSGLTTRDYEITATLQTPRKEHNLAAQTARGPRFAGKKGLGCETREDKRCCIVIIYVFVLFVCTVGTFQLLMGTL